MRLLIILLFALYCMPATAQHYEHYYDYQWHLCEPEASRFFSEITKKDSLWERKDYFIHERALQMHGYYTDTSCKVPQGDFLYYYSNKRLQSAGRYKDGHKDGLWLDYYPNGMMQDSITYTLGNRTGIEYGWHANGNLMDSIAWNNDGSGLEVSWYDNGNPSSAGRYSAGYNQNGKWQYFHKNGKLSALELYKDGVLVDKQYFDEEGNGVLDTSTTEKAAEFPGGEKAWHKFMEKNIYFPSQYKFENADKAVVVVSAIIDEDGNVTNVELYTPLYPAFDEIALKAVKHSPKWQPAIQHNRHVQYRILQAVYFTQE